MVGQAGPGHLGKKKDFGIVLAEANLITKSDKKKSGTVLLSRSQICSTIAAEVLNGRVREGNVCVNLAMGTGKNIKKKIEGGKSVVNANLVVIVFQMLDLIFECSVARTLEKKVVKPHG